MMPTIRIDDDVMKALQKKAIPLVDTPNTVLRRLLGLSKQSRREAYTRPAKSADNTPSVQLAERHPAVGSEEASLTVRTPQGQYRRLILEALYELGGSGRVSDVLASVEKKVTLTQRDKESLRSGDVRWQNSCQWERFVLVQQGLLKSDSPRGLWELTGVGVAEVETQSRLK